MKSLNNQSIPKKTASFQQSQVFSIKNNIGGERKQTKKMEKK